MKYLLIQVTAEDIKKGSSNSAYRCPVAIAVRRALKITNVMELYTGNTSINILKYEVQQVRIPLPQIAIDFIAIMDGIKTGIAEPFQFTIQIPET